MRDEILLIEEEFQTLEYSINIKISLERLMETLLLAEIHVNQMFVVIFCELFDDVCLPNLALSFHKEAVMRKFKTGVIA